MCEITAFKLPLFYLFEYVWIYENRPNFNATSLTLFEEHTQAFVLNQSQAVCHYAAYSLTLLVSGWLAGCQLLTLLGIGGQSLPCKNPLSVTHPTSLGLNPGGPAWNQLVARHLACLPQPSLTEVPPPSPGFQAQQRRKAGAKVLPEI